VRFQSSKWAGRLVRSDSRNKDPRDHVNPFRRRSTGSDDYCVCIPSSIVKSRRVSAITCSPCSITVGPSCRLVARVRLLPSTRSGPRRDRVRQDITLKGMKHTPRILPGFREGPPCRLQAAVVARRVTLGCATTLAVVQSWLTRSMDALESNVTAAYHSDADSELPPSWCLCFPRTGESASTYSSY
jgi:hypothetical protein